MISGKMISLISEQIKYEYESAYLYLEIADFYESQGLCGFANWFKVQAREEIQHAMIFYDYLHANNARVIFYDIKKSDTQISDFVSPLTESLTHEQFITKCINKIYDQAATEKDFRTMKFLGWFITEQQEEEENAMSLIDKMNLFGSGPSGLYNLDKECGKRTFNSESNKELR